MTTCPFDQRIADLEEYLDMVEQGKIEPDMALLHRLRALLDKNR